jgi:hypothetical protein
VKKVLTTFAFGSQASLLEVSLPTMRRYADTHGYKLFVPPQPVDFTRPWAWYKIPHIMTLAGFYDVVLWLDADVAVLRHDRDIADDAASPINMVVHHTPDGAVPSTGVMVVRGGDLFHDVAELLARAYSLNGFWRSTGWWEQAGVIAALGGDPDATPTSTPPGPLWGEMPYEWNPHCHDRRGVPPDSRFFHSTMFADRAAAMRQAIQQSS